MLLLLGGTVWGVSTNIQWRQQSVGTEGIADAWRHSQVCRHSWRKWSPTTESIPATTEQYWGEPMYQLHLYNFYTMGNLMLKFCMGVQWRLECGIAFVIQFLWSANEHQACIMQGNGEVGRVVFVDYVFVCTFLCRCMCAFVCLCASLFIIVVH